MKQNYLFICVIAVLCGIIYFYYRMHTNVIIGPLLKHPNTTVTSIELSLAEDHRTITAPDMCAQVIKTMGTARQCLVPLCPSFGDLTIHYEDGTVKKYYFQKSASMFEMVMVIDGKGYAISTYKMRSTLKNVGLITP